LIMQGPWYSAGSLVGKGVYKNATEIAPHATQGMMTIHTRRARIPPHRLLAMPPLTIVLIDDAMTMQMAAVRLWS